MRPIISSVMDKEEMDFLHEKSLEVLETQGISFECDEAVDFFKKHGARVDGQIVYITRDMVESALRSAPSSFVWHGRESDVTIGDGNLHMTPPYGPITVRENGEYRAPGLDDFVKLHKLTQTSPVVDIASPMLVDTRVINRLPAKIREGSRQGATLLYTSKPVQTVVDGRESTEIGLDLTRKLYGVEDLRKVVVCGNINMASPLRVSTAMCEALMVLAKNNQAMILSPGSCAGLNTPPSMGGTAVTTNALRLGTLVFAQMITPGVPVILGVHHNGSDLRYTTQTSGSIETALWTLYAKHIQDYYHLPVRGGGCLADSKQLDYECGQESMITAFMSECSGVDFVQHGVGILDVYCTVSFEKFLLDEELYLMARRFKKGFDINDDTIYMDKIRKAGPVGNYLARTQKQYREDFFLAAYQMRMSTVEWQEKGCHVAEDVARKNYEERIASYQIPDMTKEQKKLIRESILPELLPEGF